MERYCILHQRYLMVAVLLMMFIPMHAQLVLNGQLRTRTEFRNGQGTLVSKNASPAFFTSQRTRLTASLSTYRLHLHSALQDVRIWGQDASTINRTTNESRNGVMMHEAWAEIMLLDTGSAIDNFSLKIGRQELLYDDSRLLGNLDWLQQGRRHDIALLKFSEEKWQADVGLAFNQNAEFTSGNNYNGVPTGYTAGTNSIGTMYKSMQFLYVKRKLNHGYCSYLLVNDNFNKYHMDSLTKVWDRGVWSRATTGINFTERIAKDISVFASGFIQRGKNKEGKNVTGWMACLNAAYNISSALSVTLGTDWTSGNGTTSTSTDDKFDPLYGTPHKFWGYMDYFYVSSSFGLYGIEDYYIKVKLAPSKKLSLALDTHSFYTASSLNDLSGEVMGRRLGTEVDLTGLYFLTNDISLEGGYCAMLASEAMASPRIKNVPSANRIGQWAYLMINISTSLLKATK